MLSGNGRLYESIAACSPFLSMEFFLSVMSLQLFSAGGDSSVIDFVHLAASGFLGRKKDGGYSD